MICPCVKNTPRKAQVTKLEYDWDDGFAHVAKRDKRLGKVMRNWSHARLEPKRLASPFHALMRAIIYQQLSGKAAATIHGRVLDLFPSKRHVAPAGILELSDTQLRGAGVSGNKVKALRDLAQRTIAGEIPSFAKLKRLSDDEIIERITAVHGIGRWTVEMLLIFQLGRPDVLPIDDLGVRKGYAIAHGLDVLPTPKELAVLAEKWKPFRSVGSWYCWRATE
ncbi:MAG: DNA-3-methyladenine glycosylase 2 family protein [Planctomycetes bacterium]|nr:DNA-3-methyladenine glycosylase 2 family protein [Planctomycetota bacterium]